MAGTACANAPKRRDRDKDHRPGESIAQFISANGGPGADSAERIFGELHGVVMTNVCLEQLPPHLPNGSILSGSWFRSNRSSRPGSSQAFCKLPQGRPMPAGGRGGAWVPMGTGGFVVPCSGEDLLLTAPRATYCWPDTSVSPLTWREPPPDNETSWLSGVTMTSSESHISSMQRRLNPRAYPAGLTIKPHLRQIFTTGLVTCCSGAVLCDWTMSQWSVS